ncbi:MAG: glycerophosphodiester phosphodiesterase [Deltaproteobacteria bacterium]|nr:glycerophosphodiester phosphodiesterase [Deltaproteobacteria bacterium]
MADFVKIAHRGSSGSCPENTRLAFEQAMEASVDMIEMDCQLSKDGHVIVIHDERLDRTARTKGYVKTKTLKQLKKLDVGAWFKKSFKGERILTLEEVLEIVAGKVELNLEIKSVPRGPMGIELKMLFVLSHYDYLERTIFSSFDYHSLRRLRELAPDVRIGILYRDGIADNPFDAAREVNAYSIHIQQELATADFLERAGQLGLKSFVWTVNEVKEMERFLSLGVDGIISDFPEKFWKIKPRKR